MKKFVAFMFAAFLIVGCAKEDGIVNSYDNSANNPYLTNDPDPLDGFSKSILDLSLTGEEIDDLKFMREEEKLARDVYTAMYQKYGTRIFNNISLSENAHTTAVRYLLNYYNIPDPAASTPPGVFTNPELQTLYSQLIARGNTSLTEALTVGRDIEVLDIQDLENRLAHTTHTNIIRVYNNLKNGSNRHLNAFNWALNN